MLNILQYVTHTIQYDMYHRIRHMLRYGLLLVLRVQTVIIESKPMNLIEKPLIGADHKWFRACVF